MTTTKFSSIRRKPSGAIVSTYSQEFVNDFIKQASQPKAEEKDSLYYLNLYKPYAMQADGVEDFFNRYYAGNNENKAKMLQFAKLNLAKYGITWLFKFESMTGDFVSYIKN